MKTIFYIMLITGMLISGVLMANPPNAIHARYDMERQGRFTGRFGAEYLDNPSPWHPSHPERQIKGK